jgi:hypothetical protein
LKKLITLIILFLLPLLAFTGCESEVASKITIQNMADAPVWLNFRANVYTINPDRSLVLKNVPQGVYEYSTTYGVPAAALSSEASGELSGVVDIKAGTKISILYSSTFFEGVYTVYANVTTSSDQTSGNDPLLP